MRLVFLSIQAAGDPELLAVYGRRRVGKTFLIREHLKDRIVFEVAGMHEQSTSSQLAGFHAALRRAFPNVASVQPRTWLDAFEILRTCLDQSSKSKHKRVVFFDEFPWLATRKSNFLAAFENFWNDYAALFENYQTHETIVKTLAASNSGLTRDQLIEKSQLTSGGGVTKAIEELALSGFLTETLALDKKAKSSLLRLTDEFSVFYWDWMHSNTAANSWMRQATSRRYEAWCGYAFESICFKHLQQIQRGLGIADVGAHVASWHYSAKKGSQEEGAQIDLLLDRADHCIDLCEIKFSDKPFTITKSYAESLARKIRVFRERSGRHQTLFLTMITPYGVVANRYSEQLVTKQVTLSDLFGPEKTVP